MTWQFGKGGGGRVVKSWQDEKGERVVRWQGGKGGTGVARGMEGPLL